MKKLIVKYPLLIIIVLSVFLRLPQLNGSFWMDEAAQALEVTRPLNLQLQIVEDFQPPLLHLILHFAQYISQSEWYLRTVGALIPAILTVAFTYKLAELLFSKNVAVISGILLATSSFHIYYSQELRPYALPTMFAVTSMYYFIKVTRKITSFFITKKSSNNELLLLTLINTLGIYTSYLYPFFLLVQITYILFKFTFKQAKNILYSFVFSILSFVPFLPIFLLQLEQGKKISNQLIGWSSVVSVSQLKSLPLVLGKLIFGILPLDFTIIIFSFTFVLGISSSIMLLGLFYQMKTGLLKKKDNELVMLLLWIFLPFFSAWLVSFFIPIIQPKRLLYILPAVYISFAGISTQAIEQLILSNFRQLELKNKAAIVFLTTLILLNSFGIFSYYTNPKLQRENWRDLVTNIHSTFPVEDTLIIYSFEDEFAPMKWYEQQQSQQYSFVATKKFNSNQIANLANELKHAVNYKTVLVFDYLIDLTDPNRKINTVLTELGFQEIGVLDYPNIGFVRIYMQPTDLIGQLH